MSRWGCPFFGLTDKIQLHELIFDLCYYGHIEYDSIYSMPVQYRNFYVKKLMNLKEREKSQYDSLSSKNNSSSQTLARGPSINRN